MVRVGPSLHGTCHLTLQILAETDTDINAGYAGYAGYAFIGRSPSGWTLRSDDGAERAVDLGVATKRVDCSTRTRSRAMQKGHCPEDVSEDHVDGFSQQNHRLDLVTLLRHLKIIV